SIDSVGSDSWAHSLSSLARGGTLVTVGGTTGFEVPLNLLPVVADQLTITGSIMGTLKDMEDMARLIAQTGIEPEIGVVLPMDRAEEGFRAMWEGRTRGETVFIRCKRHIARRLHSCPLDNCPLPAYTSNMSSERPKPATTPCLCNALRQATRAVSRLYDE